MVRILDAEHARALREKDAESLAVLCDRALYQRGVPIGDWEGISQVVSEVAPGWEFVDVTAFDHSSPRVALTFYDGSSD